MAQPDWRDLTRKGYMHAYMIAPYNLNLSYGELTGVDWASSKISAGYFSATRTSASLTLVNGNWVPNRFIRLIYEIPEWNYKRTIGTYIVTNDNAKFQNKSWITTLELQSMMYALDAEISPWNWTLQKGSTAKDAMSLIFREARRPHALIDARDLRFSNALVLERGTSQLNRLNTLCSATNNRIDVDGYGIVTVTPLIQPGYRNPELTLSLNDKRGIVFDGIEQKSNYLSVPNRAAVYYKYSTKEPTGKINKDGSLSKRTHSVEHEITAVVSEPWSAPTGAGVRGYNTTYYESLSDLSPATQKHAEEVARQKLREKSTPICEWTISTKYLPLWEGSVVIFEVPRPPDGRYGKPVIVGNKCIVKDIELTGPYWDMKMTLQDVVSAEYGGDSL